MCCQNNLKKKEIVGVRKYNLLIMKKTTNKKQASKPAIQTVLY